MFAALLLSSAVTLAVAALALLSPLEQRLRSEGESGVFAAISSSRPEFEEIGIDPADGRPDAGELAATVSLLRHRSGAEVTVLDHRLGTIYAPADQDLAVPDYYTQVRRALRTDRGVHTLIGDDLVAVEPMQIGKGGTVDAVVLVRRLEYVISTVQVVKKAFIEAAAVGFGIALLLGIALTTTLLRRLERLREAAGELEQRGLDAPIHVDARPDEIGDLTRAFASMQTRLRRQVQARHAFVATASHELRTPLASLDGTLELLEDDLDPGRLDLRDARERMLRAREQSRRLSSLATDLLDLSRLDAEVSLRAEPVELGELCRAVAAEFERRAAERDVRIDVRHPAHACWATCDPGAVARIVRILLDNAIGIAPPGTSVHTETATDGPWAQVSVSDSGPGVPAAERERIFERFERGSAAAGRSGFGLGLAIGRELVTRMRGSLTLAEEPAEQTDATCASRDAHVAPGARFVMRLPAAQMDRQGTP
ncbi:MAG TPA: HAMP domain-containing sensor histidine kinase [Solirubrobacteraceae bacterium]|jgi:signal transduction histidine kinase|nr:HAMP domain-containing sensor histidine kinase [Solirubrobacteraceae bacterium]